jgi:hypothetical protein
LCAGRCASAGSGSPAWIRGRWSTRSLRMSSRPGCVPTRGDIQEGRPVVGQRPSRSDREPAARISR